MVDSYLLPWTGTTYRHTSPQADRNVLDFRFAGMNADNRWNVAGEPTLYLAGDPGVLIAEWGRNFGRRRSAEVGETSLERSVHRLTLRLQSVLDLRNTSLISELGREDAPMCFTEPEFAQSVAAFLRSTSPVNAILVPSIAFLDDLSRWNLVVFLDTVPIDISTWITRSEYVGPLRWR